VEVTNRNPVSTWTANIAGTAALLEATRRSPAVAQIVTASSDKAYGVQPDLPYDEGMPLLARNPYDVSKACADLLATSYWHTWGVPVCITRCGNFFGPGDLNWERLVPGTIRSLLEGRRPVIRSDGTLVRDYLYVIDGALSYLRLAEAMAGDPSLCGEAFNFSSEEPMTVVEVVDALRRLAGRDVEPEILAGAAHEIPARSVDGVGVTELVTGAHAVVHLAGANEVMVAHDPDRALADTVAAARHVAEACADAGVGRLVFVSTVHVYGRALAPGATVTEDDLPAPLSTYAIARLAAEHVVTAALPETVVLRLTNGVGRPSAPEVERWSLVANDVFRQAATTGALRLRTDGMQWRDFVALDDVCRVVAAALDPFAVPAGTYNLGSGAALTVRDLAELVQQAVESATGTRPPLSSPAPT